MFSAVPRLSPVSMTRARCRPCAAGRPWPLTLVGPRRRARSDRTRGCRLRRGRRCGPGGTWPPTARAPRESPPPFLQKACRAQPGQLAPNMAVAFLPLHTILKSGAGFDRDSARLGVGDDRAGGDDHYGLPWPPPAPANPSRHDRPRTRPRRRLARPWVSVPVCRPREAGAARPSPDAGRPSPARRFAAPRRGRPRSLPAWNHECAGTADDEQHERPVDQSDHAPPNISGGATRTATATCQTGR